ncbi:unnamed protein product [Arabidopsis thaliana]|uniref:Uncharacterized protein n=1 Tax=Arabidopsis thaliana TaxID=3702 RepID=A0A5S9YDW6_ARATH|nr:unnamed protein product [Arabidopsis thaliana]
MFGLPLFPSDLYELGKMATKARTTKPSLEEEGSPLRGILCVKTRRDTKRFEKTEDCFILDFNPFDSFDVKRLSFSLDKDLEIIHESGQVACRDYPHPRHLCLNFPFGSTSNATHCDLCYCHVCDKPAPCALWMSSHCNASADSVDPKSPTNESESYYYSD